MGERRGLIISSQCQALQRLDFLPQVGIELRDVFMEPELGGCVPAVPDRASPQVGRGLVIDPSVDELKSLIKEAFRLASRDEATLFLTYVGHATERTGKFYLQPFNGSEHPDNETGVNFGLLIEEAIEDNPRVDGIVILLDACDSGFGIQNAGDSWIRATDETGGRLEVVSAAGLAEAYDGAFSRAVTELLRDGDNTLGSTIHCTDAQQWAGQRCFPQQLPQRLGFTAGRSTARSDAGLWLSRNRRHRRRASPLRQTAAYPHIERLTEWFQPTPQVAQLVAATLRDRGIALVGDPGLGKSALAAALARPDLAPEVVSERFVHAFVALGQGDTAGRIARTITQQLSVTVTDYESALRDSEETQEPADADVGDPLVRKVGFPLRLLDREEHVRIVLDGVDQLPLDVVGELLESVRRLLADPGAARLRVLLTMRPGFVLPQGIEPFPVRLATPDEISRYLARRGVADELRAAIIQRADGRWLLARLCADIGDAGPTEPAPLSMLYDRHLRRITDEAGDANWLPTAVPTVLAVLAAAGTGPVLPIGLLRAATIELGGPGELTRLHTVLDVLGSLVVRSHPGSADEHVGLFHQTLIEHIRDQPATRWGVWAAHRALLQAIAASAPSDAVDVRSDATRYAAMAEVEHLWALERYEDAADSLDKRPVATARERQERLRRWHGHAVTELGESHPATRKIARLVARNRSKQGDRVEALREYEQVLADYQRTRGPRDKDTLSTRSRLAWELAESGAIQDALREYAAILPEQQEVAGHDHPDVYATRFGIAHWTARSGDPETAVRLMEELIEDQLGPLGPHHPLVVRNRISLADWIGRTRGAESAVALLDDVVRDATVHLDPDHKQTLKARARYLWWLRRMPKRRTRANGGTAADTGLAELGRCHPTGAWRHLLTVDPRTLAAEYEEIRDELAQAIAARQAGNVDHVVERLYHASTRATAAWSSDHYRTLEVRFTLARELAGAERYDAAYLVAQWVTSAAGFAWPRAEWKPLRQELQEFKNNCARHGAHRLRLIEVDTARGQLAPLSSQSRERFDEALRQRSGKRYSYAVELLAGVAADAAGSLGARHPLALDLRYTVASWTGRHLHWQEGLRLLDAVGADAWEFVASGGQLSGGGKTTAAVPVTGLAIESGMAETPHAKTRRGRRGGKKTRKAATATAQDVIDDSLPDPVWAAVTAPARATHADGDPRTACQLLRAVIADPAVRSTVRLRTRWLLAVWLHDLGDLDRAIAALSESRDTTALDTETATRIRNQLSGWMADRGADITRALSGLPWGEWAERGMPAEVVLAGRAASAARRVDDRDTAHAMLREAADRAATECGAGDIRTVRLRLLLAAWLQPDDPLAACKLGAETATVLDGAALRNLADKVRATVETWAMSVPQDARAARDVPMAGLPTLRRAVVAGRSPASAEPIPRPPRPVHHSPVALTAATESAPDDEFALRYRNHFLSTVDTWQPLGLRMRGRTRYPDSLPWLTVTVSQPDGRPRRFPKPGPYWYGLDERRRTVTSVPVEPAIGASPGKPVRALIRGTAGSGKTTLLHWLAIQAARRGFTGQLAGCNGCLPFLVRLRGHADTPLPTPERLLQDVADPLLDTLPEGWVHRHLTSGSALLLVDGVDEVPKTRRPEVRDWLIGLLTDYPAIRVVITARPAAVEPDWLADAEFTPMSVEPMDAEHIRLFLRHWHETAGEAASLPCPPTELPHLESRLAAQLDTRPQLAVLANTPLLCAVLCAVNLHRATELPHGAVALAGAMLDVLLEPGPASGLDTGQREAVLRDLAWRLVLDDTAELDRAAAVEHLTRVPSLRPADESAEAVLNDLVVRGVLRGQVGPVEFAHEIFLAYAAAGAAVAGGHVDTLVRHAHRDTCRHVVTLACGLAGPEQLSALLRGVLDRVDAGGPEAPVLRSLVGACLDALGDRDQDLDERTRARLDRVVLEHVVPPANAAEARSLAAVGRPLLRYLPRHLHDLPDDRAAAVVHAAGHTGSVDALGVLARYATDPREKVQRELIRCWRYFDPERYAREVLADAALVNGGITVALRRAVPHVRYLGHAETVRVRLTEAEPVGDFRSFTDVPNLIEITAWCAGTVDLAPLAAHPNLDALSLHGGSGYTGLDVLRRLPRLSRLWLQPLDPGSIPHIEFVRELTGVTSLFLTQLQRVTDYGPLAPLDHINTLGLTHAAINSLDAIPPLPELARLNLNDSAVADLGQLGSRFPRLINLYLERTDVEDLRPLADVALTVLAVRDCPVRDLGPLARKQLTLYLSPERDYDGMDRLESEVEIIREQ